MAVYGNASGIIRGVITTEPIHIDGEDGVGVVRIYIEDGRFKYELTDGTIGDAGAATGVEIDDTLSVEGAAADAKAVGDMFALGDSALLLINGKIPSEASSTNKLTDKAYVDGTVNIHGLTTENDIADADELAFYDTSASGRRKTAWSNIKAKLKTYFDTLYLGASALTGYATQAWVNAQGFITSLAGYATQVWVQSQGYGTYSKPSGGIPSSDLAAGVIPTVNDAVLTIKQGGAVKGTFSANASSATEINLDAGGGGADNIFVVTGSYDGFQFGTFSATYAQIIAAYKAGKIVELHLATDESGTEFVLPLKCVVETSGEIYFGADNTYSYYDDHRFFEVVCGDNNLWDFVGYDYAKKDDLGELADLDTTDKSSIVAAINEVAASGGTGWTSAQITLLETVFANLKYVDGSTGQTAAAQLIASLRGATPSEYDVSFAEGVLSILKAPATQSGAVLTIS